MADGAPAKSPYDVQDGDFKAGPDDNDAPEDEQYFGQPQKLGSKQSESEPEAETQPQQLQAPTGGGESGAGGSGSEQRPFEDEHEGMGTAKKAVIAAVAVAIIVILVYQFVLVRPTGTSSTTTVPASFNINSCTTVSKSGTYQITGDISTSITNGSCITVTAGNVTIHGSGHYLIGSGPFVSRKPYSYAIFVESASGVNISGLTIAKFSYGVYLNNSSHVMVSGITVNNATLSGIYLNNTSYSTLYLDHVRGSASKSGGIVIAHGRNNTLDFDTSEYNSYSGLNISNSTGNRVFNSTLIGNPSDIACAANSSFSFSNRFSNTTCYVNSQCNFAYCSQTNVQSNISGMTLPYAVNQCGGINHPGTYSLAGNLDMNNYLNLTLQEGKTAPCLTVNASNVYISCNGHTISNAHYGLSAVGQFNVTVGNCNFNNDTYGLYLQNLITFKLHNVDASGGSYGVYIAGSTGGNLTGVNSERNTYGYYVNGTTYVTVTGFTASNNVYGVSIDNSTNVFFKEGTAISNSKIDLYCSTGTYNSTLLGFSQGTCGSTDCNWANSCPIKYLPGLGAYPITACTTITIPGAYQLNDNIFSAGTGTCFKVDASYVTINCNGHLITGPGSTSGYAFSVENETNVAIDGCKINGYLEGVHAVNAGHISVQGTAISSVGDGISLTNSSNSDITMNNVTSFSMSGVLLNYSNGSTVENNYVNSGAGSGFALKGSFNNSVENNIANFSAYGYYLSGSRDNTVSNNIASGSTSYDYYCAQDSGAVNAQPVAIDSGNNKLNCRWLVETPLIQQLQGCMALNGPEDISLSQDMVYPYGSYCFSAYQNNSISVAGTVINCNGHTILATKGGSFADFKNSGGVTLENCVFVGFTDPIVFTTSKGSSDRIMVINDTVFSAETGITVTNATNSAVNNDTLIDVPKGINLYGYDNGAVSEDSFSNTIIGVYLNNSVLVDLLDNNFYRTQTGIVLVNSTQLTLGKNVFTGSQSYGLFCTGSSSPNKSATDLGTNVCPTGASGCKWATSTFCRNT